MNYVVRVVVCLCVVLLCCVFVVGVAACLLFLVFDCLRVRLFSMCRVCCLLFIYIYVLCVVLFCFMMSRDCLLL